MESINTGNRRLYFGIILIAIGGVWILERLNIISGEWRDMLISWQTLLIIIGVVSLVNGNATSGWILIFLGGFFMVPHLFEIPWELRRLFWPIMLVGVGVVMLVRHTRKTDPLLVAGTEPKNINYFDDFVVFGGREMLINSQSLIGGKSTAIFGGSEYDLRSARLSPNGAVIDCVSVFGGTGFKVPPDWTIKNEVSTIFGAFTDKRGMALPDTNDLTKTLIIRGFTAFGGIEIKNF